MRTFDFSHVITFFNKLSEAELKAWPTANLLSKRVLHVQLVTTDSGWYCTEGLLWWLRQLEHVTEERTKVVVIYQALVFSDGFLSRSGLEAEQGLMSW